MAYGHGRTLRFQFWCDPTAFGAIRPRTTPSECLVVALQASLEPALAVFCALFSLIVRRGGQSNVLDAQAGHVANQLHQVERCHGPAPFGPNLFEPT